MASIVLTSAKGSPGASVAALSLAWSWPHKVIVAECDPAGSDAMPGILQGQFDQIIGIGELPVMHARERLDTDFWGQLIILDDPKRDKLLLPGVMALSDAAGVATAAHTLAEFLTGLDSWQPAYDVIADSGRLSAANTMWPLLDQADLVLLVVTGTMSSIQHTRMAIDAWRERHGNDHGNLRLLVIQDGPYHDQIAKKLDVPVLGALPWERRAAKILSRGPLKDLNSHNALVRAWKGLHPAIREAIKDARIRRGVQEVSHVA